MVKWLAAAGSFGALAGCSRELVPYAAERPIEISAAEQVILQDREAGRRFFMESVSAADREGRQEITVTGRESAFDTLVIAADVSGCDQYFKDRSWNEKCER